MPFRPAPAALLLATVLAVGCTSEQIYNAGAGFRRNECNKLGDQAQRDRCVKEEADRPYSAYSAASAARR